VITYLGFVYLSNCSRYWMGLIVLSRAKPVRGMSYNSTCPDLKRMIPLLEAPYRKPFSFRIDTSNFHG